MKFQGKVEMTSLSKGLECQANNIFFSRKRGPSETEFEQRNVDDCVTEGKES